MSQVATVIADDLYFITEDLKVLPRIMDKFTGTEFEMKSLHRVIADDFECQRLQHLLEDGMNNILITEAFLVLIPLNLQK